MRRLLRRLPSPAVVIASAALFVALAGAGAAASLFLVRAPQPTMLVSGQVGADGLVTGPGLSGGRVSEGDYVITIRGDMFSPTSSARTKHLRAFVEPTFTVNASGLRTIPPQCGVVSTDISSNGGGTARVLCYSVDGTTWVEQDASFDLALLGPSR